MTTANPNASGVTRDDSRLLLNSMLILAEKLDGDFDPEISEQFVSTSRLLLKRGLYHEALSLASAAIQHINTEEEHHARSLKAIRTARNVIGEVISHIGANNTETAKEALHALSNATGFLKPWDRLDRDVARDWENYSQSLMEGNGQTMKDILRFVDIASQDTGAFAKIIREQRALLRSTAG